MFGKVIWSLLQGMTESDFFFASLFIFCTNSLFYKQLFDSFVTYDFEQFLTSQVEKLEKCVCPQKTL